MTKSDKKAAKRRLKKAAAKSGRKKPGKKERLAALEAKVQKLEAAVFLKPRRRTRRPGRSPRTAVVAGDGE
jgi:hypothetical protein